MSFPPDKYRDEDDPGVNDDAGEWSPGPFLDWLGSEPVTIEKLMEYMDMYPELDKEVVTVEEVLKRMRKSRA